MAESKRGNAASSSGATKDSGIIGNKIGIDYHFFVAMTSCLNGYKIKQSNPNYEFTIKQECEGVGLFDDIVYEYKEKNEASWTRLLVQIKYKKTFDNKIKTGSLLFDSKKETFSLPQFMKSTENIKDTENCFFIIFTSACLDLEDGGQLRKWYKKGVEDPITLLPSKVSCVSVFNSNSQYKFNEPINIPIFNKYTGIEIEQDWKTFLNKLILVIGPRDLDRAEKNIEETIEGILPKATEIIWNRLYKMVDYGLKNHKNITSEQISELFEIVETEIQEGYHNKYEECKFEFESHIPVKEFLSSDCTTLPIVSSNSELTLHKVCKEIKKLRENKLMNIYTMKHLNSVKEVKDIRNTLSFNLLIILIKNSDQLDMFEILKNNNQKYIIIISNDQNVSTIQNSYQLYRDVDHFFKALTDRSKQDVLDNKCILFNEQEFSFGEILKTNSSRLTEELVEELNGVITEDVLMCFFNNDYECLKLNFNRVGINKMGIYIKRRLIYRAVIEICKIDKFKEGYIIDDIRSFKSHCEEMPDVTCHYFIKRNNHLLWVKTNGDTKYLKKFINEHTYTDFEFTEDELCGVNANRILISNNPGMGKTSLVSSLFHQLQKKHPTDVIIRLNLNDHTTSFNKSPAFDNIKTIADFIKNELLTKVELSTLSQNVLDYILQSKKTIFLFLDGFDEICPNYKDTVVHFIQSLKKYTSCKLLVTTRPGQINTLERVLSTSALSIQPFTKVNKLSYLKQTLGLKNIYTKVLLEEINQRSTLTELLGIPLLLFIITEILIHGIDVKLNITKTFNVSTLFNEFVRQKFKIYSEEKMKLDSSNVPSQKEIEKLRKIYEKEHEILALRLLFNEYITKEEIDFEQITKIGIVMHANTQTIEFIHKTFAEYFVATYIQKHFHEDRVIRILFKKALVMNDLTVLKPFINSYIGEKLTDFETVLKYKHYVKDNYNNIVNDPVLNILYTAVIGNNSKTVTFILECFKEYQNVLDIMMSYKGNEIALDYAIIHDMIKIAKQIIHYCDKNIMNKDCEAYRFTFGVGDILGNTALQGAAREGHTEVVSLLLAKGANVDISNIYGRSALYNAANQGHTEMVSLLLAKGANVDIADTYGNTALHIATKQGHAEVVSLILDKGASVDKADADGKTALHWATIYGYTEVVRLLLAKDASMDIAETDGWTALHRALFQGKTEVMRLLLANGASVDLTDHHSIAALNVAYKMGHFKAAHVFLKSVIDTSEYGDGDSD